VQDELMSSVYRPTVDTEDTARGLAQVLGGMDFEGHTLGAGSGTYVHARSTNGLHAEFFVLLADGARGFPGIDHVRGPAFLYVGDTERTREIHALFAAAGLALAARRVWARGGEDLPCRTHVPTPAARGALVVWRQIRPICAEEEDEEPQARFAAWQRRQAEGRRGPPCPEVDALLTGLQARFPAHGRAWADAAARADGEFVYLELPQVDYAAVMKHLIDAAQRDGLQIHDLAAGKAVHCWHDRFSAAQRDTFRRLAERLKTTHAESPGSAAFGRTMDLAVELADNGEEEMAAEDLLRAADTAGLALTEDERAFLASAEDLSYGHEPT
jgi:hypothetical protein